MNASRLLASVLAATAVLLSGCGNVDESPENAAKESVIREMEKWTSGKESKATTMDARIGLLKPPISYRIRTVVPTDPFVPTDVLVKHPKAAKEAKTAFRVVVDVDFRSEADTELKKVVEYNVTWVGQINDWTIHEEF